MLTAAIEKGGAYIMCMKGQELPLTLNDGSSVMVDSCMRNLLQALNDAGIPTVASCCGHGKVSSQIYFAPGPSQIRFSAYGCCGEGWSVSLEWWHTPPGDGQKETRNADTR